MRQMKANSGELSQAPNVQSQDVTPKDSLRNHAIRNHAITQSASSLNARATKSFDTNTNLRTNPPNASKRSVKRAIIFARWARSASNGIPENDLDAYMAAHFAFMHAQQSGDKDQLERPAKP